MKIGLRTSTVLCGVLICCCASSVSANVEDGLQEYCQFDTFRPQCPHGEIIVIKDAIYGRRHIGKCIDSDEANRFKDPQYIGCYNNVRHLLDAKCSGRKSCEVRIPDAELEQDSPCLKGLKMYLEASYTCLSVVEEDRSCIVSVTSNPQHISRPSRVSRSVLQPDVETSCGTKTQPWILEAPAGQRINISLLDFTPNTAAAATNFHSPEVLGSSHANLGGSCNHDEMKRQYGFIVDKVASAANRKNVSMCSRAGSSRVTNAYLSTANSVELVLSSDVDKPASQRLSFLVRIEAVGCTDLMPPEDAWIKRQDDKIIVGCYTSRQTWQLRCHDGRWIGVVSNCTQFSLSLQASEAKTDSDVVVNSADNLRVVITVAIGFAGLAICLTIICCGVVCLQRSYSKTAIKAQAMRYEDLPQYNASMLSSNAVVSSSANSSQSCNGPRNFTLLSA